MYGKELIFPLKDKHRLINLLSKLGINWQDCSQESYAETSDTATVDSPETGKVSEVSEDRTGSKVVIPKFSTEVSSMPPSSKETTEKKDYFDVLERCTETSESELQKIAHRAVNPNRNKDRCKYECSKCGETNKFFAQAEHHFMNHELEESSLVRNTLKSVELQRIIDSKNLSKMEKAISKVEDKKLLIAARKVMNNLQKHTATLDSLKDMPMPEQFRSKMMELSALTAENIEKAKTLIDRIQHSI